MAKKQSKRERKPQVEKAVALKYNQEEDNTLPALMELKRNGYTIVSTTPHEDDVLLDDLPLDNKIALIFGTELRGLSETAMKNSDMFVKIPMYGFTESFNISVSAAIILHFLIEKMKRSDLEWRLDESEIIDIKLDWARQVVKRSELIEADFLKNL